MNGQKVWSVISRILLALAFVGCSYAVEAGAAPVVTVIPPGSNAASGSYNSAANPFSVTFTPNEAATIYYTTSGADPTTASTPLTVATPGSPTAPISVTLGGQPLKFFDGSSTIQSWQFNTALPIALN